MGTIDHTQQFRDTYSDEDYEQLTVPEKLYLALMDELIVIDMEPDAVIGSLASIRKLEMKGWKFTPPKTKK